MIAQNLHHPMFPKDCVQRTILIEDLTPSLIDLLGATFMIPPHVFEEHLDRSGYRMVPEDRDIPVTWHARSSTQGYSSITWYRPVLPLIPINPRFRNRLISNRIPTVRCFFRDCGRHDLRLRTLGNIWRRPLDICPEPGIHYKNSSTEYPVAWEERVTMWTQDFDGCKFVVILLDPLPIVVDEISGAVQRRIRREEGVSQAPDRSQARQIDDWIPPPPPLPPSPPPLSSALASSATSPSLPPPPPPPLLPLPLSTGVVSSQTPKSQASTTGARVESPEDEFVPATLRRRATQAFMENYPTPNGGEGAETRTQQGRRFSVGVPQPVFPESDQETRIVDDHGPFVPYHPIRTRSSSFAVSGHDTTALDARTYIESLQVPTSTLDEFEYLIQLHTKGKEVAHDSFHPLLRAIHDDTLSLVGIIRVTLRRIREGTLDEDLMQRRILFWRTLLYRLSFSLAELDGQLREFKQFSSDSTFGSRSELPSEKLAKDTQQALRSCMDLIDKSSDSLRAEMQIVDSRRSIAEAESVSKLTELAFVFIPLSFVASLFSMQIRELDGGVRLYQFVLVAMAFVLVAYTVRLSIRSSRIIEYKNKTFKQIREAAQLQYNDPIPTRIFLIWIGMAMSKSVYKMTRTSIAILTPTVLILAAIAAILSPVILLWVRGINRGFSAVITVILLLLDVLLLYPVVTNSAGEIDFNPRTMVRNIQRSRRIVRKQKKKARAKRRQKQGLDPEFGGADDSSSSSSTSTRRVSTRVSIITET
ncbi:hypothetical protein K504DRAFT_10796 [Pleomassaria siparia CBS 279.74]|uniref:Cora-domain-containing protein n=1 Tax=Pleomassaria siparia CBS 279.74 TaxID=1314801 RepID=A0A6G1KPL8_9PLEO|nr:hypothetical protein K504DRAFT_10796 [Pleomassaria siparia CBS 279.74]